MHAESLVHLGRAQQLFPGDAEILAAKGRLHETFAAPGIQQFLAGSAGANGDASRALMGSSRSNLRQAEISLSKAVELDGRFAAARLHLGRVLGLQGHHEDAASQLRRAADTADDSMTQYYAWLFLGVEEQALARADRAHESFDKAAGLYPRAQSPQLALGQLARRQGDRAGALAAIQHVLAPSAVDRDSEDPWSTYLAGGVAEAQTRLSELRALLFLTPDER
jgi:tetratricopeptide (TPR) repeat protein